MHTFLITIDVEDWFQVENLRPWYPHESWPGCELRVERNVHKLLDLFDQASAHSSSLNPINPINSTNPINSINSINSKNSTNPIRVTFFILGWIAERLPGLVREIAARGHEVASHGFSHRMCRRLPDAELKEDLAGSKRLLEDTVGREVGGFRAPNFSVDDRVLGLIAEAGYTYDSSYNNFALHGRYGKITLNGQPRSGIAYQLADNFFELPISNLPLSSLPILGILGNLAHFRHCPFGGGAYFRLLPLPVFSAGVRSILNSQGAYNFYLHPWEIDPAQPRVDRAGLFSKFKHYSNLSSTEDKLRKMILTFTACEFTTCRSYIDRFFEAMPAPILQTGTA